MSGWWLASYVVLWSIVLATLVVLLVVLRQLGLIYLRSGGIGLRLDEGPAVGSVLNPFDEVDDRTGQVVRFPAAAGDLNLLLFASPTCDICKDALRGLGPAMRGRSISALVVSDGAKEENVELRRLTGAAAHFVTSAERLQQLRVEALPYGIVTNSTGVVLDKAVINNIVDLEDLLDRAADQSTRFGEAIPAYGGR